MKLRLFAIFISISILGAAPLDAFDQEYSRYASLLNKYIRNQMVAYSALRAERTELTAALKEFQSLSEAEYKSFSREQQLAFWINAYNLWMIAIVVDHYPIQPKAKNPSYPENSVQQIAGVWDTIPLSAAGREVSLNQIEHEILRKQFREPRIHFALVCASTGCPPLKSQPFRARELDAQLESAARGFIEDRAKVELVVASRELRLSPIFQWFPEDFSSFADDVWRERYGKYGGAVGFVSERLRQQDRMLLRTGSVQLKWLSYDWTLNDQR